MVARRIIQPTIDKRELAHAFSVERAPLELANDTVECGVGMSRHDDGCLVRELGEKLRTCSSRRQ